MIDISNNLGDAKSLITHPCHHDPSCHGSRGRASIGLGDGVIQISVASREPTTCWPIDRALG